MQITGLPYLSAVVRDDADVTEPGQPDRSRLTGLNGLSRLASALTRRRESLAAAAIAALALLSYTWNLSYAGYSTYYSTGARSMSMSWRALAFGSFDPGAHITLDKLSGFLVPQALSARVFGFHPWALALPQAIEGVVTVLVVYRIGCRWRGAAVGLLAAFVTTVTPVFASMFGHVMEDGLLTMSLTVALLCWQSALLRPRLRSVLAAGAWIGIGFQAKMLDAWLLLPGLIVGLLLLGELSRRRRAALTAGLAGTAVVTSLLWMAVVQCFPAGRRPFVDGTSNNNMFTMVFGYNGLNRVVPGLLSGVLSGNRASSRIPVLSSVRPAHRAVRLPAIPSGLEHDKLVLPYYATQIGWLYPAVAAGVVLELAVLVRLGRLNRRQRTAAEPAAAGTGSGLSPAAATTVALAIWLLLTAVLLTATRVPHVAYLAAIGVQQALFAAAGLARLVRRRRRHRTWLPVLVLASVGWSAYLVWGGGVGPSTLAWLGLVGGLGSAAMLLRTQQKVGRLAVAVAVVSILLAPTVWTGYVFGRTTGGSAGEAYTGPRPSGHDRFRLGRPFARVADPAPSSSQQRFLQYLADHQLRSGTVLTDNWTIAASYLLVTRWQVLSMGGFSGRAPTPSLPELRRLIQRGSIRVALLTHGYPTNGVARSLVGANDLWIRAHCAAIPGFGLRDRYVTPARAIDLYRCDSPTVPPAQP